jgi:ribulose 1,5-bisphosphate synthetase/thiazole synthase
MSADIDDHSEVDLLIAGAGPAGMTAALVASLEGLDVLLCEKSDQVGGTGSTSAGTLWIPGNSQAMRPASRIAPSRPTAIWMH